MKALFYLSSAVALLFAFGAPSATAQDNVAAIRKPVYVRRYNPQGNLVQFVAATIVERTDPTELTESALAHGPFSGLSVMHLEGSVEITIFNKAIVPHPSNLDELFPKEMVLTADEADYDPKTGEIQPQGHVSIKLQNAATSAK
jgi:hypothetical protein